VEEEKRHGDKGWVDKTGRGLETRGRCLTFAV